MKKTLFVIVAAMLICTTVCFAQGKDLLLDNFEGAVSGGLGGTVDYGAGNGSSVEVSGATDVTFHYKQSLKANYDAVAGGYIYIARGFGLDANGAAWLVKPEDIDWSKYNAIAFYMFGSDSKTKIAIDVKDNGGEMWRFITEDNFQGWKQVICPFAGFFARSDWQPDSADKNSAMDFPLKSYQFEPLPPAKGTLYLDYAELIANKS